MIESVCVCGGEGEGGGGEEHTSPSEYVCVYRHELNKSTKM